jgi:hypothetical protein
MFGKEWYYYLYRISIKRSVSQFINFVKSMHCALIIFKFFKSPLVSEVQPIPKILFDILLIG